MTDTVVPDHVPSELVTTFDLDFRGPLEQLFPRFDAIRAAGRVLYVNPFGRLAGGSGEAVPGMWMFTRAEDIRQAFQRSDLFSNSSTGDGGAPTMIPISMDPPEHTKYRHILTPMFSPVTVGKMEPSIRQRAVSLIEGVKDEGECDFVTEFALEFPTKVFTNWIGLPEDSTRTFVDMVSALIHGTDEERGAAIGPALEALTTLINDRMANPTDDLMSDIIRQQVDGRDLTFDELMSMAYLLFLAGLDTVAAALSFSFWHLAQTPADRRALASGSVEPAKAVEELLRRHSFVNLSRLVTRDAEFAGVQLKEGDRVLLSLPVASRDPEEFEDPTNIHLDRDANRHYAFGAGPHRCIGSHLARIEMRVWFEEWHKRIPDYELAGPATAYAGTVMGVTSLPLRWR